MRVGPYIIARRYTYEQSRDFISEAKPRTLEGILAKARAAKAEAVGLDGEDQPDGSMGEIWARDLVGDLLALAVPS